MDDGDAYCMVIFRDAVEIDQHFLIRWSPDRYNLYKYKHSFNIIDIYNVTEFDITKNMSVHC